MGNFFDKGKTFRPKKKFQPGTMKYSLHKQAQASLNSGINLRQVVKLPKGEDFNDWLAVHWWISSTELTSYMAQCVNSVQKRAAQQCREDPSLSTYGRMG